MNAQQQQFTGKLAFNTAVFYKIVHVRNEMHIYAAKHSNIHTIFICAYRSCVYLHTLGE